eukprot:jgi/Picsp_1/1708/NSC_05182-R1_---NA---
MSFTYTRPQNQRCSAELPVHVYVRTKSERSDLLPEDILLRTGKIQIAIGLVYSLVLVIKSFLTGTVWLDIENSEILWSLWIGVIGCVAVFSAQGVKTDKKGSVLWFAVAVLLQLLWIASELVLQTPFDKILSVFSFVTANTSNWLLLFKYISKGVAIMTILGVASVWNHLMKRRQSRRHRRLSSITYEELKEYDICGNNDEISQSRSSGRVCHGPYVEKIPLPVPQSPIESYSSESSGGLSTGLPSPVGHYREREADLGMKMSQGKMEADACRQLEGLCFVEFTIDTNETVFFVHRNLRPIKTRLEDCRDAHYRPLLRTLIKESKERHGQWIEPIREINNGDVEGIRMIPSACVRA